MAALRRGGYELKRLLVCERPGGAKARQPVAFKGGKKVLLSHKLQETGGSAEQKTAFEVLSLVTFLKEKAWEKAYVILTGAGWNLREWLVGGGLKHFLPYPGSLRLVSVCSGGHWGQPSK